MRQRKLEVFVSSTVKDLEEERRNVIDAILEAGHIPNGMELWASGPAPTLEQISSHLDRCDVHLIFVFARCGYTIKDAHDDIEKSITEWEYDKSLRDERPIIAFTLTDDDFEREIAVELGKSRTKGERAKSEEIIRRLRGKVRENRFAKPIAKKDSSELGRHCVNSLSQIEHGESLPDDSGWTRLDSDDAKQLAKIKSNPFLRTAVRSLYSLDELSERVERNRPEKQALADHFWPLMAGRLRRRERTKLFIESGTTLAYVTDGFSEKVLKQSHDTKDWTVATNNTSTVLQLMLQTDVPVVLLPQGTPDSKFGAVYGIQATRHPTESPQLKPRELYEDEKEIVNKLKEQLVKDRQRLLLGTAAGFDSTHDEEKFRGPFARVHPNMLIKRAMYDSGLPLVVFLTASKLLRAQFVQGKHYPVFDLARTWNNAATDIPLCYCIGFAADEKNEYWNSAKERCERLISSLHPLTQYAVYPSKAREKLVAGVLLMANDAFRELIPEE